MEVVWATLAASLLLSLLAGIAMFWQVMRRREAVEALDDCQDQVARLQGKTQRQEAAIRELSAAARAEKAHVEQLRRQLDFARANRSSIGLQE